MAIVLADAIWIKIKFVYVYTYNFSTTIYQLLALILFLDYPLYIKRKIDTAVSDHIEIIYIDIYSISDG